MASESTHDFVAVNGRLDVLIVQQQPELEARHRSNSLETHELLVVVFQFAI